MLYLVCIVVAGEMSTIWQVLGGQTQRTCMRKRCRCTISFRSQEIWYSSVLPQFTGSRHLWVAFWSE